MTHKAKAKDLTCHAVHNHKHFTLFNVNTCKPRKPYLKLSMVVSLVYYSGVLVTLVLQFCCTFKVSALNV